MYSPEMLVVQPADTVATVEGHALRCALVSDVRGAGVSEQGMLSRDRREPGRPCLFRWITGNSSRVQAERRVMTCRESERPMVPLKVGNRCSPGPTGGTGSPEEEAR